MLREPKEEEKRDGESKKHNTWKDQPEDLKEQHPEPTDTFPAAHSPSLNVNHKNERKHTQRMSPRELG